MCFFTAGYKIVGDEHEFILRRSTRELKERRFFRCELHGRPASQWFDNPTTPFEEGLKVPNNINLEVWDTVAIPGLDKNSKIRGLDEKVRIMIARPSPPSEDSHDIVFHPRLGVWYNAHQVGYALVVASRSEGPDGAPVMGDEGEGVKEENEDDDDKTAQITTTCDDGHEVGTKEENAPFMEWEMRV